MGSIAAAEGALILLLCLSAMAYAVLFLPQKGKPVSAVVRAPAKTWKEKILDELAFLEGPFHVQQPKPAMASFAALVDIYLRECYKLDCTALTTPEIIERFAKMNAVEQAKVVSFLLQESDWVKFSKETRQEEQWQSLFSQFRQLLPA